MVQADRGNDADFRRNDVGLVVLAPNADFNYGIVAIFMGKIGKGHGHFVFKSHQAKVWVLVLLAHCRHRLPNLIGHAQEVRIADPLAVELDALIKADDVRGNEKASLLTGLLEQITQLV